MVRSILALIVLTLSITPYVAPLGANESNPSYVITQEGLEEAGVIILKQPVKEKKEIIEISKKEIKDIAEDKPAKISYQSYKLPKTNGFKSYMSYKAITNKSSKQYKLQSEYAYTGDYGIRTYDDRYCIAIGTAYNANVGSYVDLILKNGTVIPCIVAEIKSNQHTDSTNRITKSNGCVSEFLVDTSSMHKAAKQSGDMSSVDETWDSPVSKILVYEQNVFGN